MLTTCIVDLFHERLTTGAGHEIYLKGQNRCKDSVFDSDVQHNVKVVSPVSEPANTHIVAAENLSVLSAESGYVLSVKMIGFLASVSWKYQYW